MENSHNLRKKVGTILNDKKEQLWKSSLVPSLHGRYSKHNTWVHMVQRVLCCIIMEMHDRSHHTNKYKRIHHVYRTEEGSGTNMWWFEWWGKCDRCWSLVLLEREWHTQFRKHWVTRMPDPVELSWHHTSDYVSVHRVLLTRNSLVRSGTVPVHLHNLQRERIEILYWGAPCVVWSEISSS